MFNPASISPAGISNTGTPSKTERKVFSSIFLRESVVPFQTESAMLQVLIHNLPGNEPSGSFPQPTPLQNTLMRCSEMSTRKLFNLIPLQKGKNLYVPAASSSDTFSQNW